jgi:hypothetical protein
LYKKNTFKALKLRRMIFAARIGLKPKLKIKTTQYFGKKLHGKRQPIRPTSRWESGSNLQRNGARFGLD